MLGCSRGKLPFIRTFTSLPTMLKCQHVKSNTNSRGFYSKVAIHKNFFCVISATMTTIIETGLLRCTIMTKIVLQIMTCPQSYKPAGPSTVPPQTDSNVLISRCSESPGFLIGRPGKTKSPLVGLPVANQLIWNILAVDRNRWW